MLPEKRLRALPAYRARDQLQRALDALAEGPKAQRRVRLRVRRALLRLPKRQRALIRPLDRPKLRRQIGSLSPSGSRPESIGTEGTPASTAAAAAAAAAPPTEPGKDVADA